MNDLQNVYLHHRASGLAFEQAVEAIAMETDVTMATVSAQINRQASLDEQAGTNPRSWLKPRHRQLAKLSSRDTDRCQNRD